MARVIAIALLLCSMAQAHAAAEPVSKTGVEALQGKWLENSVGLNFRDAELEEVLGTIAKFGGMKVSVPPAPNRKLSLEAYGVSARRALEAIADNQKLFYRQVGDTIFVERQIERGADAGGRDREGEAGKSKK